VSNRTRRNSEIDLDTFLISHTWNIGLRAGRAVIYGISAFLLSWAEPYTVMSPISVFLIAVCLGFVNRTKWIAETLLVILLALALTPEIVIQKLVASL
jgi:hypothetical protein